MCYSRIGNTYLAAKRSVSLEAIALAWLCQTQVIVAITMLGVKSVDQPERNLRAIDINLSDEELHALKIPNSLTLDFPDWMIVNNSDARQRPLRTNIAEQTRGLRYNKLAIQNRLSGGK